MTQLKNCQTTEDPRLDRIVQFDERSRQYGITAVVDPALPLRSYTWACSVWLDQGSEGACFTGDVLIRMADGSHRPIADLRLLDEVVTAEGNTGTISQLMARRADRGLVEVKIAGHIPLRCTPEHPILTSHGYVPAEKLTPGTLVAVTRHHAAGDELLDSGPLVNVAGIRGVIAGEVNTGGVITTIAPVPVVLARTPALGRLIGLYAAEGNTTVNKVVWNFGKHERDTLVAETCDLIKTVFDAEPRIQERPNGAIIVVLYGKTWRQLFEKLVPGTSKHGDKRLSAHVSHGSQEYLRALLEGWLDGDGHNRRTERVGVSVCRALALDMHAIATALGYRPHIRQSAPVMNRHAATRQVRYEVGFGTGGGSARSAEQDDYAMWRKVRSVEPVEFDGDVYNFEVEGDHSYVADGIGVHNCTGFACGHHRAARPRPGVISNDGARAIYHRARQLDDLPGEDYEGTSVLAAIKASTEFGYIRTYRWAFSLEDLARAVGYAGPAILGINWLAGMAQTGAGGYVHATGDVLGGHAILCRGVNTRSRTFRLHNSWGPDWGVSGDCLVSFDDMEKLLHDDGEAAIPTKA